MEQVQIEQTKSPYKMTDRELQIHICTTLIQIRGILKTISEGDIL
jgi:hypothetical protein